MLVIFILKRYNIFTESIYIWQIIPVGKIGDLTKVHQLHIWAKTKQIHEKWFFSKLHPLENRWCWTWTRLTTIKWWVINIWIWIKWMQSSYLNAWCSNGGVRPRGAVPGMGEPKAPIIYIIGVWALSTVRNSRATTHHKFSINSPFNCCQSCSSPAPSVFQLTTVLRKTIFVIFLQNMYRHCFTQRVEHWL